MSSIAGAVFGFVCLVLVIAGVLFVASVNAQQAPLTDSYGNTYSSTTNTSQALATSESIAPGFGVLILLAATVLVCMVIFSFYLAARVFVN